MLGFFIANTIIGIIATAAMSSFLWIISGLGIMNVDMIRAIGSIYTDPKKKPYFQGSLCTLLQVSCSLIFIFYV